MSEDIAGPEDRVLVTGATGFIGSRVIDNLLERGFRNVRCFVRPSSDSTKVEFLSRRRRGVAVEVVQGNLLSKQDCITATNDVAVVYHLAAGTGSNSFPDAYLNSVVTTRNLVEASLRHRCLRRFVNVSSFAVYSNIGNPHWRLLDESCPLERYPAFRDAYCFAKLRQEELVAEYGREAGLPYVTVRPGHVYGPSQDGMSGRVGVDTFGIFLHLGGPNRLPSTYVDNCADAIALAGLRAGIDGEIFNILDDELPSSRQFLRLYKRHVRQFGSIYVPHVVSYALCYLWERYSTWSEGQLRQTFNRSRWHAFWKRTRYSNLKARTQLGWVPAVSLAEGLKRHFESFQTDNPHA